MIHSGSKISSNSEFFLIMETAYWAFSNSLFILFWYHSSHKYFNAVRTFKASFLLPHCKVFVQGFKS